MKQSNKKEKHYHRFQKKYFPNKKVFFQCVDCPSYYHDMYIVGQEAKCWYCEKIFKVYRQQISSGQAKLHCSDCYSPKGFGNKRYKEQLKERVESKFNKYEIEQSIDSIFEELNKQEKKKTGTE